jgi:hypothetical protein
MIDDAYAEHDPGDSTFVAPKLGKTLVPQDSEFGEPVRREYRWLQTYTAAEWLELLRTASNHRLLPDDRREQLSPRSPTRLAPKAARISIAMSQPCGRCSASSWS